MATYTFDKIEYGGNIYVVQDSGALQLTGGSVTGPVTFGDSITVDEATLGDLVVNGNASFTNNIQANTINGVTVGSSPKFTDTNTEVSTLTLAAGTTAGTSLTHGGKFTLTAGSKTVSFTMPSDNNTTYTFANGTNGFTVTPSGGSAQTVTVTPSITNNVTGSGTSGYLAKWSGANTLTNGPQLGSATTTYLNNAGNWTTPPDTKTLVVNLSWSGETCSTDKTAQQVYEAFTNGQSVILLDDEDYCYPLIFVQGYPSTGYYYVIFGINRDNGSTSNNYVSFILVTNSQGSTCSYTTTSVELQTRRLLKTATLAVANWSSKQQTVTVQNVSSTSAVVVSPAAASHNEYCSCGVYCSAQGSNSLTFTCSEVPSSALTVNVMILNAS